MDELRKKKGRRSRALMVGVGLDADGHKRLTTGPNFVLAGGSKETHESMTEKVVKINEKITARKKTLDTISHSEFEDIAHSVGLRQIDAETDKP